MHKKFKDFLKNPKMFEEYNEIAGRYLDSMKMSVKVYEYMTEFYEFLKNYELKTEDIVYVKYYGAKVVYVTFDTFVEMVANNCFNRDEQILFKDNTVMCRWEYDGSEGWEYITLPRTSPKKYNKRMVAEFLWGKKSCYVEDEDD